MGTERDIAHESPCSCGKGKYIIYVCSPDHPYVRNNQMSLEFRINCTYCESKYELESRDGKVYPILREEIKKSEELSAQWSSFTKEIFDMVKHKGYLKEFVTRLKFLKSVVAVHRTLKSLIYVHQGIQRFRKEFNHSAPESWIEQNVRYNDWPNILKWSGKTDPEIEELISKAEQLRERSEHVPVAGQPIYEIQ